MANIIALIWDCDKTLIDGYMQDPIFEEYGVDPHDFWEDVNAEPSKIEAKGMRVNHDTYYLNRFIKESQQGGRGKGKAWQAHRFCFQTSVCYHIF